MIRYKSPKGNVFRSRGPLLRYLQNNRLKSKEQLAILKKQLKTNQGLHVTELLKNDKAKVDAWMTDAVNAWDISQDINIDLNRRERFGDVHSRC